MTLGDIDCETGFGTCTLSVGGDLHIFSWECDRAVVHLAAAINFAVRTGWPEGPSKIFNEFGERIKSR
jgi:hypothetical protein